MGGGGLNKKINKKSYNVNSVFFRLGNTNRWLQRHGKWTSFSCMVIMNLQKAWNTTSVKSVDVFKVNSSGEVTSLFFFFLAMKRSCHVSGNRTTLCLFLLFSLVLFFAQLFMDLSSADISLMWLNFILSLGFHSSHNIF